MVPIMDLGMGTMVGYHRGYYGGHRRYGYHGRHFKGVDIMVR